METLVSIAHKLGGANGNKTGRSPTVQLTSTRFLHGSLTSTTHLLRCHPGGSLSSQQNIYNQPSCWDSVLLFFIHTAPPRPIDLYRLLTPRSSWRHPLSNSSITQTAWSLGGRKSAQYNLFPDYQALQHSVVKDAVIQSSATSSASYPPTYDTAPGTHLKPTGHIVHLCI